ncbi:MAG: SGNH/GDSL hydrolase family protein [Acetobacteraceae bacterium]|nr:SGNH/GDSL hydrolase family protein [Acetobacteraceae bacterium]
MAAINEQNLGFPSTSAFLAAEAAVLAGAPGAGVPSLIGSVSVPDPAQRPVAPFSAIYAFGDSLSDAGNSYIITGGKAPVSPPYSEGRSSNGPVWVQDLSQSLGLGPLEPSLAPPSVPNRTDFAIGFAQTGTTELHAATSIDLPAQLAAFEAAVPNPSPDALYTVSIGANDLFGAIASLSTQPAAALKTIQSAVGNVDNFVSGLASHGAKNLLFLTVPDLGLTPAATSQGPLASVTASALSALFDTELTVSLEFVASADHVRLDVVDAYSLSKQQVSDPSAFGFTNVTDPVWTGNNTDPSSGTLRATTPAAQNQYLFWDHVHPTARGHAIAAAFAYESLTQPA